MPSVSTNNVKKFSKLEIKLNRLLAQKAALQHKLKLKSISDRRARNRTLIQVGGLLSLTPILDICNINPGDDLQINHQDKADILLGILSVVFEDLSNNFDSSDLDNFKNIGAFIRSTYSLL